ncbi:MAG: dihydrofolate reductase family protein [Microbacteriaceae bacterium]|nr:dihydrofolate reductase family protein [Microbacteriaceae bacterium]MCL2793736.1 dihydrofolate reductase family protein [Microbacteriaceae bacterium]
MARLIYSATASLDGYIADMHGDFQWAAPDEDVHQHINDRHRGVGTFLHGRRMYDVMSYWEDFPDNATPAVARDWAHIWRDATKVVYSRSLDAPSTARTRLEREFDAAAVRTLVDASERDVAIGGAEIAGQALAAGIVDELQLHAVPVVVGGGTSWLPAGVRVELELLESRAFPGGTLFARYAVRR